MTSLLRRSSWRYLTAHPAQVGLAILGVALGVAVAVAIDLANASAERAFRLSTESVTGRATHQIVGGPSGVPDSLFANLVTALPTGNQRFLATPVLERWVSTPLSEGRTLRLVGVDLLSEGAFRPHLAALGATGREFDLGPFLTEPGAVALGMETAEELGLEVGDALPVAVDGQLRELQIIAVLEGQEERGSQALGDLILADLATAQETLGSLQRLSRIDLILPSGTDSETLVTGLQRRLPSGIRLLPAETRTNAVAGMLDAFQLNLRALSLLAMVCGTFLVYNTISFSVVQRRELLGRLRVLGVRRREVFRLVLGEAAIIGCIGAVIGILLGIVLGSGLVHLVTQTINDLYFQLTVRRLVLAPTVLLEGLLLGVGASIVAALVPAREAAATAPRQALQRSALEGKLRRQLPRTVIFGIGLIAFGALLLWPAGSVLLAFGGVFLLLLGFAVLTPAAVIALMRAARPLAYRLFGLLGSMAARGVTASLSRTAVAIAALTIAVSVTVGMGVMIDSFRHTLVRWLGHTLAADIYVSPTRPGSPGAAGAPLQPEVAERIAALAGVDRVNTLRSVVLDTDSGPLRLSAADLDERGRDSFDFRYGERNEVWQQMAQGAVMISEPFAYRRGLAVGDQLRLPTDAGPRSFPVAGVYYDYGSDQGVVLMERPTYDRWFDDRGFSALAVFVQPGTDVDSVLAGVRRVAGPRQQLIARSNREIRQLSLEIFDRTFAITDVLRLLAGAVAFLGVLGALMALQLERGREIGVLRANGLTPRQVWKLVTGETTLMGLASGLLSLPVGWVLAMVMIEIVNRRSFGWTLQVTLSPSIFLQAVLLALVAAVLAGLFPAHRLAATSPATALRQD
ncbi:MAG: FtsX-like permease family protein [Acidobacteriota bacterium]